jgi:hypothetical protein
MHDIEIGENNSEWLPRSRLTEAQESAVHFTFMLLPQAFTNRELDVKKLGWSAQLNTAIPNASPSNPITQQEADIQLRTLNLVHLKGYLWKEKTDRQQKQEMPAQVTPDLDGVVTPNHGYYRRVRVGSCQTVSSQVGESFEVAAQDTRHRRHKVLRQRAAGFRARTPPSIADPTSVGPLPSELPGLDTFRSIPSQLQTSQHLEQTSSPYL